MTTKNILDSVITELLDKELITTEDEGMLIKWVDAKKAVKFGELLLEYSNRFSAPLDKKFMTQLRRAALNLLKEEKLLSEESRPFLSRIPLPKLSSVALLLAGFFAHWFFFTGKSPNPVQMDQSAIVTAIKAQTETILAKLNEEKTIEAPILEEGLRKYMANRDSQPVATDSNSAYKIRWLKLKISLITAILNQNHQPYTREQVNQMVQNMNDENFDLSRAEAMFRKFTLPAEQGTTTRDNSPVVLTDDAT